MRITTFIKRILFFMKPHYIFKMAAPVPPLLKYLIVHNLLNFPSILIKFVSKFTVCKVLYFKAQYLLWLRSPINTEQIYRIYAKYSDRWA